LSFREQGPALLRGRSDEESRYGSLITKTFSPQGTQRVGPRRENLDLFVGL